MPGAIYKMIGPRVSGWMDDHAYGPTASGMAVPTKQEKSAEADLNSNSNSNSEVLEEEESKFEVVVEALSLFDRELGSVEFRAGDRSCRGASDGALS